MLSITDLTKEYHNIKAIDNFSFQLEKGEIVGILGINGAGKSTLLKIIAGALLPTEGEISLNQQNIKTSPLEYRNLIGYLPEHPPLYEEHTVKEFLLFMMELKKIPKSSHLTELQRVSKLTELNEVLNRVMSNLSKGFKQRIGIAQALIGNPSLIILDEPFNGLDPQQMAQIRGVISDLRKEHIIIISSHIINELESIANRIIVIHQGRMIANSTLSNFKEITANRYAIFLELKRNQENYQEFLSTIKREFAAVLYSFYEKEEHLSTSQIKLITTKDIREPLFNLCKNLNIVLLTLRKSELTLEEIFLNLLNPQNRVENESNI